MDKNLPFFRRLSFALQGLHRAWTDESSFRTHLVFAVLAILTAVAFKAAPVWWAILALAIGLVVTAELVNTATERLADYVQPQFHDDIKVVKDVAAGAVLVASLVALAVAAAFLAEQFL